MFFSRISFKIGFWYSVAFLLSSLLLYALTAYVLLHSLQRKDRDLLQEKVQEYSALYARDGVAGLQTRVSSHKIKNAHDFVVRLADSEGKTIFIHSPDRSEDPNAPQLRDIDIYLLSHPIADGWLVIPATDFGDDVEVVSKALGSGEVLQVGKDTEDREEFFKSFTRAYFEGLVPIFFIAILVGVILSNRLLRPIRWLTQTVESIRSGNPKARVELHPSKDELWRLGTLFNAMLEQNERLLQGMRDTVDNVAHDLRTPIMRLQNSVEEVLSQPRDLDRYEEALVDCKENSENVLRLLNGIMDVSEADAGTLRLHLEDVPASDVVQAVIDLYGFVAEEKGIALTARIGSDFKASVDRTRVIQAVANLVDNAIKYSPQSSAVVIESASAQGYGEIRVIDQGPGIMESELERIWDRLYRTDSSRSSRGLGLGLSLVKAIARAHGGQAGVTVNKAGGSTFYVRFKHS